MIKKIKKYLPSYPHYKMNIFSGTNTVEEVNLVRKVLREKGNIVRGKAIAEYECALRDTLCSNDVFTFASGRMGFYSILKAIGIEEGDEVIIPSFTCVVVPNAIQYSGARPVYCDIEVNSYNIDVSKIEGLITKRTKVIYAQHTFGQMADVLEIKEIAKRYNLIVIEDAALALGAELHSMKAGTIGDFGYFSTDRSKVINTGLGGVVSVNNEKYQKRFSEFYDKVPYLNDSVTEKIAKTFYRNISTLNPRNYWVGKFFNAVLTFLGFMYYFNDEKIHNSVASLNYPYPARLSNILALIGVSQISSLEDNIKHRKSTAKYYNSVLNIYSSSYMEKDENIFLRYSFMVKNREYWEKRFSSKIDLAVWFKSIASGKNENFGDIGYKKGDCPVSEYVTEHIFNLPTHMNIKPERLKKMLQELRDSNDIIKEIEK